MSDTCEVFWATYASAEWVVQTMHSVTNGIRMYQTLHTQSSCRGLEQNMSIHYRLSSESPSWCSSMHFGTDNHVAIKWVEPAQW